MVSIVSSPEAPQYILYKNKINYYYPMGIDIADYVVLGVTQTDNSFEYNGATSYLGAEESKKNRCMFTKQAKRFGV
jgi:hypothetical protein